MVLLLPMGLMIFRKFIIKNNNKIIKIHLWINERSLTKVDMSIPNTYEEAPSLSCTQLETIILQ